MIVVLSLAPLSSIPLPLRLLSIIIIDRIDDSFISTRVGNIALCQSVILKEVDLSLWSQVVNRLVTLRIWRRDLGGTRCGSIVIEVVSSGLWWSLSTQLARYQVAGGAIVCLNALTGLVFELLHLMLVRAGLGLLIVVHVDAWPDLGVHILVDWPVWVCLILACVLGMCWRDKSVMMWISLSAAVSGVRAESLAWDWLNGTIRILSGAISSILIAVMLLLV